MSQPMPDFIQSPYFDAEKFTMKDDAPEVLKKAFEDWIKEGEEAVEEGIGL
jgi:hypothetical protein